MRLGRSDRERFSGRYAGQAAEAYEEARQDAKWDAEEAIFDELYASVRPASVLDCPVGTGRFFDRYVRDGVSVLGVDLSDDMLAQAAGKIPAGAPIRLQKADALDPRQASALGSGHDLIVCVRFVYAVPRRELPVLFRNFSATRARHLLVGVRIRPEAASLRERLLWRFWNPRKRRPRLPFGGRSSRYIQTEPEFLRLLRDNGWEMAEKRGVQEGYGFGRYFYLFRNLHG